MMCSGMLIATGSEDASIKVSMNIVAKLYTVVVGIIIKWRVVIA